MCGSVGVCGCVWVCVCGCVGVCGCVCAEAEEDILEYGVKIEGGRWGRKGKSFRESIHTKTPLILFLIFDTIMELNCLYI